MPTNNPTQPDSNPDTAEAKIDEILGHFKSWLIGASSDEANWLTRAEAVQQLKGLLVDARIDELEHIPHHTFWYSGHGNNMSVLDRIAALQQTRQEEDA